MKILPDIYAILQQNRLNFWLRKKQDLFYIAIKKSTSQVLF